MTPRLRWFLLLALALGIFYWKILLTRQFSILLTDHGANVAYARTHFAVASVKQGMIPLWDPYTASGQSLAGKASAGLFYPPKLLFYLWPLRPGGLLSPQFYQVFFVLTHLAGALFLFLLAEELGLVGWPAFVASLCWAIAGFFGRLGAPHLVDAAIWLPLVVLGVLRAIRVQDTLRRIAYASASGVAVAMATLAGGPHLGMMDLVVAISTAAWWTYQSSTPPAWKRFASIVVTVAAWAFATAAVQLLPAFAPDGLERVLYSEAGETNLVLPRALFGLIVDAPFGGGSLGADDPSLYFGVLPLLLVIFGVWRNWGQPAVKYLSTLAVLALFYTLGMYSFLHGLLYSLSPYLWMPRDPARFIYLTHFSMALLAGYGVRSVFSPESGERDALRAFSGVLKWIGIALAVALLVPALYASLVVPESAYVTLLFLLASYGLVLYILQRQRWGAAALLTAAIILCDLSAVPSPVLNRLREQRAGRDHLRLLFEARGVTNFLRSQPGPFRVHIEAPARPNIGDLYGVQTTSAIEASASYQRFLSAVPRAGGLLNVGYVVRPAAITDPGPVYTDANWKVYAVQPGCPRAWVVYRTVIEPSEEGAVRRLADAGFDPLQTAVISTPLEGPLHPPAGGSTSEVSYGSSSPNRIELRARAAARGLLVLSEIYDPGWRAAVNGMPAQVHKVNGLLRGVVVPAGESRVVLEYAPRSVLAGAMMSSLSLLATLILVIFARRLARRRRAQHAEAGV